MKAQQQLRKPENWQDFETLCKKLWGEIWKCPEIKKNGRSGQAQHGIDVYGIPFGETQYYGIQCKGKDDYTNSTLTEKEIDREIKLAMDFEPSLKKMYFTTTANKDAVIESYVRKKNIEHIKKGLFEVHLYCWEDIVDLIDENKQTHDYYVKSMNFKTAHEIEFVFENDKTELTLEVPFSKTTTHYRQKIIPVGHELYGKRFSAFDALKNIQLNSKSSFGYNHSYARFSLRLRNLGTEPLKEYKIFLEFEGHFESVDTCSEDFPIINLNIRPDTYISNEERQGKIVPKNKILVQEDSVSFDTIHLKPLRLETEVKIKWRLVSLDFREEGELLLTIIPIYKIQEKTVLVDDPFEVRIEEGIVGDYITDDKGMDD